MACSPCSRTGTSTFPAWTRRSSRTSTRASSCRKSRARRSGPTVRQPDGRCLRPHASVQRALCPLRLSLATPLAVHCRGRPAASVCPLANPNLPPAAALCRRAACRRKRKPLQRHSRARLAQPAEAARSARCVRRHEQDGHQPLGQAFCHQRRRHDREGAGGGAPRRQAGRAGGAGAGGGDWRRHQPGARLATAQPARAASSRSSCPQVISLAGELLNFAEELIRDGLHPSEILEGYKKASVKVR
jgi:hypothetical protein